ncbi:MAG: hypothetical protein K6F50_04580 [Kiritimatiellae bacterium]|nr:hypothetical protein [Kiritimatiellia bacterium]
MDASKAISGDIGKENVNLSMSWGANFGDYSITDGNGKTRKVDFQDIMVSVSEFRAVSVEGEVAPLTARIKARNNYLDKLGEALAAVTKKQADFKSDDEGSKTMSGYFSVNVSDTIRKAGCAQYLKTNNGAGTEADATKAGIEGILQQLKSTIDGLNNRAQADMTRLQGLVDRRDESYTTASNLMSAVSDTRSNTIRNM